MGCSQSCLCPDSESTRTRREVLVMKEDGELLRFGQGMRVKDVLAANPCHKVIQCRSDRSVLPDSHHLSCSRLYFLLPEGVAVSDATYDRLVRAAVVKGLVFSKAKAINKGGDRKLPPPELDGASSDGQDVMGDLGYRKSPWAPSLQTIPEVISPPLHANL